MKEKSGLKNRRKRLSQGGFSLLEYCAGAAIIAGIVWASLSTFGGSLNTMFTTLGTWATTRAGEINMDAPVVPEPPTGGTN